MERSIYERYPSLVCVKEKIDKALELLTDLYKNGGTLFVCGNGGSAADGEHIVGELMKSFKLRRDVKHDFAEKLKACGEYGDKLAVGLERALPAISLNTHEALSSAYINDREPELVYAQQLFGLAKPNDMLLTLTTSGNSANCIYAAVTAKAMDMKVIAMTGCSGGKIAELADVTINVPEKETYLVQELHLPIYHYLCAELEKTFFDNDIQ